MKVKIAVEMEFDLPNVQVKKFEKCVGEFCKDIAKDVADETASNMAPFGIGVKYVDFSWIGENDTKYKDGVLYFGE